MRNVTETTEFRLSETEASKSLFSKDYNYIFSKHTGNFWRWGKEIDDDPDYSPFGPEIADIEISTICSGIDGKPCKFCYKSNGPKGKYMSIELFRKVFDKLPKSLTQIAFGIGDIDGNPDMWKIFHHCRMNGIIPNVTINGDRMTPTQYDRLGALCGAVAVSRYAPKDVCYNAVKELTKRMNQVNIHMLLAEETYKDCLQTVEDAKKDTRLKKLRAIVFLALKPVGRGTTLTTMKSVEKYRKLVEKALSLDVGFGFDSCSAPMFLAAMKENKNYKRFESLAEPCESLLFSIYISVDSTVYPCSFLEHGKGIDIKRANSFHYDVWNNSATLEWRKNLLDTAKAGLVKGCRQCPVYSKLYPEK